MPTTKVSKLNTTKPTMKPPPWREVLPVHPAADAYPLLSKEDLRSLADDIKANGLQALATAYRGKSGEFEVLDGRNRLDAETLLGNEVVIFERGVWQVNPNYVYYYTKGIPDVPAFVASCNLHRRHLTAEQKAAALQALLQDQPEASDREIARKLKVSPTTVGKGRKKLATEGKIKTPDTVRQKGGGQQRRVKAKKVALKPSPIEGMKKLPRLTQEEIDPELKEGENFKEKHGQVVTRTAEQRARDRFKEWTIFWRGTAREWVKQQSDVDDNWLRKPDRNDVDRLKEALNVLRPAVQRIEALIGVAETALQRKPT